VQTVAVRLTGAEVGRRGAEMHPAQFQRLSAVPVSKKSKVPDLDEAGRQGMEQETADELSSLESHGAASVVVPRIAPAKANLSVLEAYEPSVGDGDAMGVAGRILQNMLGAAERSLGVDHHSLRLKPPAKLCFRIRFSISSRLI
jgi:hypothetical protein